MHRENPEATRERSYGRFLYNRFRYFDPEVGRYVSADPIGQFSLLRFAGRLLPMALQTPESLGSASIRSELEGYGSLNLYGYAIADPVNWFDPTGLGPFRNSTNHPVKVSASNPSGPGRIEFYVGPKEQIDATNPGPTSTGDVDGVDFNGDGEVEHYSNLGDLYPNGEKIPDTPAFPKGTGVVCEVVPHPEAGRRRRGDTPGISIFAVVPRVGGVVHPFPW
jgi:hypothetical protein